MIPTKIDSDVLKAFDDANLSLGQIWAHKWKGYDVKITFIKRKVAGVKVEELATGKVDAFCIELFLERFSYKGSINDTDKD